MRPVTPPPRLYLLLARRAGVGVIFRRGPSKRTEVIRWDTDGDVFERGHWFHGRIYERRCDLSPDGELLVYFASKFDRHTTSRDSDTSYAWTAVSRPPWLTALALWPKGDCWHGGGLFLGNRHLRLNHRPEAAAPHPRLPPTGLRVEPDPEAHGEDAPIHAARLDRDGWVMERPWEVEWKAESWRFVTIVSELRARSHPALPFRIVKERWLEGLKHRETFRVDGPGTPIQLPSGRVDWMDWDQRGRLVVLADGAVHVAEPTADRIGELRALVDFTADRPVAREPAAGALAW